MKNFKKMFGVAALSVVVFLSACKKDDPDPAGACENGAFKATINGEVATASSFNNTLLKAKRAGVDGKRMDFRATDDEGRQLIISFTDFSTGMEGNGISTDAYIPFEDVETGTENTVLFTIIESNVSYSFISGTLDVTSCDANAKTVSGTFFVF